VRDVIHEVRHQALQPGLHLGAVALHFHIDRRVDHRHDDHALCQVVEHLAQEVGEELRDLALVQVAQLRASWVARARYLGMAGPLSLLSLLTLSSTVAGAAELKAHIVLERLTRRQRRR